MSAVAPWTPDKTLTLRATAEQQRRYEARDLKGEYYRYRWPDVGWQGRNKTGNFVCAVARKELARLGYRTLIPDTSRLGRDTFILATYSGKRRGPEPDAAFRRTRDFFGAEAVAALNAEADALRMAHGLVGKGGDPDLLAVRTRARGERFVFAEVKGPRDRIRPQQDLVFTLIQKHLRVPVWLIDVAIERVRRR